MSLEPFDQSDNAGNKRQKKWNGSKPTICQSCLMPLKTTFIDGKTRQGPWGMFCVACYEFIGVGLGIGRGQLYSLDPTTGDWNKVEKRLPRKV